MERGQPSRQIYLLSNIHNLCQERGISIAELERESGLGNGVVRKWDKASPTLRSVAAVARYFGVTLETLVSKRV
ncbi:MAG: helix-turn-helix transcriptional regulator [Oscillospiraceae bacterium]|nr:helix-turn-helix transcriptional regulator [Oscillospiraceae bacterium]